MTPRTFFGFLRSPLLDKMWTHLWPLHFLACAHVLESGASLSPICVVQTWRCWWMISNQCENNLIETNGWRCWLWSKSLLRQPLLSNNGFSIFYTVQCSEAKNWWVSRNSGAIDGRKYNSNTQQHADMFREKFRIPFIVPLIWCVCGFYTVRSDTWGNTKNWLLPKVDYHMIFSSDW